MALVPVRYHVQITDVNGDTAVTSFQSRADDGVGNTDLAAIVATLNTFATDVAAVTNGKITEKSFTVLVDKAQYLVGTSPPADNKYPSVTDGARIQFANAQGERTSLTIPAPIEAVFGALSMVVDSTQTNMATLIAFIKANAEDVNGNLLNLYKGGIKVGKRARRRRSALVP